MTKRILALMLAVLLAVSCFALTACGGEEEKENSNTNQGTENEGTENEGTENEGNQGTTGTETPGTETPGTEIPGTDTPVDDDVVVEEVTLFEDSTKIDTGKTFALADAFFSLAEEFAYSSSNEAVATVDAEGVITGVAEGTATITIYVVAGGKNHEKATFEVTVTAPWQPTDKNSQEALAAKETLTKYETLEWFNVNVTGLPEYNVDNLESATAGPVEIWSNHLQFLFRFQQSEVNATIGWEDQETYAFWFDFYYREYDENNDRGDYKKASIQAWSVYTDQNAIYRCLFYDAFFVENDGLVEGTEYEVIIVVREGETQKGWAESSFTWTDSCEQFLKAALNDPTIIK